MKMSNRSRKNEERSVRKAHQNNRKHKELSNSYFVDDENYAGFSNQLATLGLTLKDIPGDGNCLFRALGDQLEGNSHRHFHHREETVRYMVEHRADFEPFVEDGCSFADHVHKLRQDGTYAGNDAIVAFARNNGTNVVIHQLNAPMWTITGNERSRRQLHIAYHNGDHYSSVRKVSDDPNGPTNIRLASKHENKSTTSRRESRRGHVGRKRSPTTPQWDSNVDDDDSYPDNWSDGNHIWDHNGTGTRIFPGTNIPNTTNRTNTTPPQKKLSNKNRREQARKERKKRSDERKKNRTPPSDSDDSTILVKNMDILKI